MIRSFGQILIRRHIVINALRVSLVVGMLLNVINQGSAFIDGLTIAWGQVLMNFVVPYCVASYSAAKNEIERNKNK
jgi:exosome complex RNA-binding protein Rrp42 (RNase PH superfamily)